MNLPSVTDVFHRMLTFISGMYIYYTLFFISLSISSEILSSVTFAYPCVVLIFVCPIILDILSMGTPAETIKVPKV